MRVKIYCDLYISGHWMNKKDKLVEKLHKNRLQPMVYVITLSQGEQNHLEFFPSILLKQHVFDHERGERDDATYYFIDFKNNRNPDPGDPWLDPAGRCGHPSQSGEIYGESLL